MNPDQHENRVLFLKKALRECESRFSAIASMTADAVIMVDENQKIIFFNKGAEQIFGYQFSELLGQPLDLLIPDRFAQSHRKQIDIFGAETTPSRFMKERKTKILGRRKAGSEFPAEASISKWKQNGRTIFTTVLRDISERMKLEKLSTLDPLTGLYNRNYLSHALRREWKRSVRFDKYLGCLMIDLDCFKEINDTAGHLCGDNLLKEMAEVISPMVRGYDFCARYGGDEFIVVLSNNSKEGIQIVAERLRSIIFQHCFIKEKGLNLKITASIGCLILKGTGVEDQEKIIDLADQALYMAKKNGKNRVHLIDYPSTCTNPETRRS